ncbi:hypothetical protein SODG_001709 [Sodalis praecaptivus]
MMRWKLLTLAAMLATITALATVVRLQYVKITRLKQANQSMVAERDAARAQFTHYEQAIARGCKIICVNGIFSKTFKGLQNAYQQRSY